MSVFDSIDSVFGADFANGPTVNPQYQPLQPKREWVEPSPVEHWCTYCQGHNSHNCQFNTNFPRIQTYVTNTTNPPKREWVGLTHAEAKDLVDESCRADPLSLTRKVEAKLKEKNSCNS